MTKSSPPVLRVVVSQGLPQHNFIFNRDFIFRNLSKINSRMLNSKNLPQINESLQAIIYSVMKIPLT